MNRKELIESINQIENNFDVNSLTYNDLRVWPIIRAYLHLQRLIKLKNPNSSSRNRWWKKFQTGFKFLNSIFKYYITDRKNSRFSLQKADVLFIFDENGKVQHPNSNSWINKFAYPLIRSIKKYHPVFFIEHSDNQELKTPRSFPSFYLNPSYFNFILKESLKNEMVSSSNHILNFDKLMEFIQNNKITVSISEVIIIKRIQKILRFKKYFKCILAKIRPKTVIFPVYYTNLNFGLILACNELSILSVEIQHGQQGEKHPTYSNWDNYPPIKYELHPDVFWMWGTANVKRINNWAKVSAIHVVDGGNPWIDYYIKNFKNEQQNNVVGGIEKYEKKILVSTQFFEDFLNSFIIEQMKLNDPNQFFFIRMHPAQIKFKETVKQALIKLGCKNFEMEIANNVELYELFQIVDYNITFWSTVAYEAQLFGLKNIIVHPNGLSSMNVYIKEGVFAYASNIIELNNALTKFNYQEPVNPYIRSDFNDLKNNIEKLLLMSQSNTFKWES